jgi:hypothetical protein
MSYAALLKLRSTLAPSHQSTLNALAVKLLTVNRGRHVGRPVETWSRQIKQATPSLTTEECDALATCALSVLAHDSTLLAAWQVPASTSLQMSFNLQYLQLQNSMQQENRQFTLVYNIMKTKHDTARHIINNVH